MDHSGGYGGLYSGWSDLLVSAMTQLGYNIVHIHNRIAQFIAKFYNVQEVFVKVLENSPITTPSLTSQQQRIFNWGIFGNIAFDKNRSFELDQPSNTSIWSSS